MKPKLGVSFLRNNVDHFYRNLRSHFDVKSFYKKAKQSCSTIYYRCLEGLMLKFGVTFLRTTEKAKRQGANVTGLLSSLGTNLSNVVTFL